MLADQITSITPIVLGLSHVLWAGLWADMATQFIRSRHPAGAGMIGGTIALILGLLLVLPHHHDQGVRVLTVVVGWILVVKGAAWLLLPGLMLALVPRRPVAIARLSVFWGVVAMTAGGVLASHAFDATAPNSVATPIESAP